MKPFVTNRHGQIVFPSNFFPELDFTVFETGAQFEAIVKRDFGEKAPKDADLLARLEGGQYQGRYELLRDVALHMFWVNRYLLTMYEQRPTRWRDMPRYRHDVFLPLFKPEGPSDMTAAFERAYWTLPSTWDGEAEDRCFEILLNVVRNKMGAGTDQTALPPTVSEILTDPRNLTYRVRDYDPDYAGYDREEVIDCAHPVPELEALMRQAMVLHNQYRWSPKTSDRVEVGRLRDDDYVVALHPRSPAVLDFIRRVRAGSTARVRPVAAESRRPITPYPPVVVRERFTILPKIEALTVYKGEILCSNEDLIRNHAYCWSCMTADEIREKTGIEQRVYTELSLEDMALRTAQAALLKSGRRPEEIGGLLFCSCTSSRLIPSVATWLSGQLGLYQTHASCDIVAACAGMSYGLGEALRLLQEVARPVLVVCAEKFSDKIGTVRTSRMIFADGAAAMVIAPAPGGAAPDIEVFQTYASGPWSQVDAIIWPNPEFDNNITVYGPEVKSLVKRYLAQMIGELNALPRPDGGPGSLMDAVDLIIPHQANKSMVSTLAQGAGVAPERLYFDIERVGNTSAASIPIAIHDAVREGRIDRRMRVFTPGFGAGAVAGYAVMQVDPQIVG
ncbi:MAG TPA: 3-oxoacyl-[acyl-carrier-protein] synthase III C-terminal domain-containing protein [Candidatus Sulfotelmatobacter sp.]|nr:3-oxoacyl-[acyl-carrier-protein] synthase III C-terminal domain-containing protein [Candidatus Sulfotelmatobacter sp.]